MRGNVVRYNLIHDILGYGRKGREWRSPHFAFGIYLDDWTSGTLVTGNLIYRTPRGGLFFNSGQDNVIENNIAVDGIEELSTVARWFPELELHRLGTHDLGLRRNTFRHNILAGGGERTAVYNCLNHCADSEGRLDMAGNTFDENVIWRGGRELVVRYRRLEELGLNEKKDLVRLHRPPLLADVPWDEWQEMGFDRHSLIADPLFVDPAHDDYRLRPDSPAWALGFQPLPIAEMGPYASAYRATWPIVEAEGAREHPTQTGG